MADFDFNSAISCATVSSAVSSYFSDAPSGPTNVSELYSHFNSGDMIEGCNSYSAVSFYQVDQKPKSITNYEQDFVFDVGGEEQERASLSAEELFDGGMIRPLRSLSPLEQLPAGTNKKILGDILSLEVQRKEDNPFNKATHNAQKRPERGRERVHCLLHSSSSSGHRKTRSLSPLRVSQFSWEEGQWLHKNTKLSFPTSPPALPKLSSSSSKGCKKWSFKDLFLFSTASEGRATTNKDTLRKYTAPLMNKQENVKNSSGSSCMTIEKTRRKDPLSAHEMHYKVNRAISEDLKRKTFLPYKHAILG